ncbi:MAG: alpha/beta hydrolase, partial [Candidatus Marinimicrobia bacterium]|nr:alpha/beta hydrolase [Candidatus Neomarinimicrobiota bacterium]
EYRLGSQGFRHPAPLEDAQAALRTVRLRAAEFGVLPRKLGIMGSSAGGHLAAHTLTAWPRTDLGAALRPDFGVLCYPVITMNGPHTHQGCRSLLAGPDAPDAILAELSCERHVTAETPPCFIWHTAQDRSVPVENSLDFAAALRRNGVPFELHVYARGGHGLGLRAPFNWAADCRRWLDQITAA